MDRSQQLSNWLTSKKELAKNNGETMFQGIPDSWFESANWCCENGHVYSMYLKSEKYGSVCLGCGKPVFLFPKNATIEEYSEVIESEAGNG
ncbi:MULTISPECIES: hypothetical protein [Sphingobacterium]|uniref:hypothetical protein n=1 Tax=Sphingobacterium TaxID=28453 RepID=UPI00258057F0|nr:MULTISPECIES: hypothetical protein [Sphingobacterium]